MTNVNTSQYGEALEGEAEYWPPYPKEVDIGKRYSVCINDLNGEIIAVDLNLIY